MTEGIRVPEKRKRPGVCYAVTDDGMELAVVDVTNPAFDLKVDPADLPRLSAISLKRMKLLSILPKWLKRAMMRGSIIGRSMTDDPQHEYMSGITTYLFKLGPENIGSWAGHLDRHATESIAAVCVRMRLQAVAELQASSLLKQLDRNPGVPVHMINIGGGPAADSFNALLLIRKETHLKLEGRKLCIHVLDVNKEGPNFGRRCLDALRSADGPLCGLDIALKYTSYNWSDATVLEALLRSLKTPFSIMCGSSEGGLFEYGTDEEITANLRILHEHTPDSFTMTGSLMQDERIADPGLKRMKALRKMTYRLLGLERFTVLAGNAGWQVDEVRKADRFYVIVRLVKS